MRSRVANWLAVVLVLFAVLAPGSVADIGPAAVLRIPIEGVLGLAAVLVVPPRVRPWLALGGGGVLGCVSVLKLLDMGFGLALGRPFDPVLDWGAVADGAEFVAHAFGMGVAVLGCTLAALSAGAVLVLLPWAAVRLSRLAVRRRSAAAQAAILLAGLWLVAAAVPVHGAPGVQLAAADVVSGLRDRGRQMRDGLRDHAEFVADAAQDRFRDRSGADLLRGLRGKDVIVVFIESYGRSAIEDPGLAPLIDDRLAEGDRQLAAAGFSARSGFLTSPTSGGGSWLAHSTFLSGVWIDNQARHTNLMASDRLTLVGAFARAGWRTVAVLPGTTLPWPEGHTFYGYDRIYPAGDLDYRGPSFSWAPMPDQFALAALERLERGPGHPPLMAEVELVSSHAPWTPVPRLIPWDAVGDGTVFATMAGENAPPEAILTRDPARVRADYVRSIDYSLAQLTSYVQHHGDDNSVFIVLGDHQPSPVVTGPGAAREVPIALIARDPSVLDAVAGWGWTSGLQPARDAPIWPMDSFRDRFLGAFANAANRPAAASPSQHR